MDRDYPSDKQSGNAAPPPNKKRVYVKPAFQVDRAFETMALSCGKVTTTQAQCRFNRKSS